MWRIARIWGARRRWLPWSMTGGPFFGSADDEV